MNQLEHLSDVIERHEDGGGNRYWIVGEKSAYLPSREAAYQLAREWYPNLIDDEDA